MILENKTSFCNVIFKHNHFVGKQKQNKYKTEIIFKKRNYSTRMTPSYEGITLAIYLYVPMRKYIQYSI